MANPEPSSSASSDETDGQEYVSRRNPLEILCLRWNNKMTSTEIDRHSDFVLRQINLHTSHSSWSPSRWVPTYQQVLEAANSLINEFDAQLKAWGHGWRTTWNPYAAPGSRAFGQPWNLEHNSGGGYGENPNPFEVLGFPPGERVYSGHEIANQADFVKTLHVRAGNNGDQLTVGYWVPSWRQVETACHQLLNDSDLQSVRVPSGPLIPRWNPWASSGSPLASIPLGHATRGSKFSNDGRTSR